ncbi:MAG: molecular chaperone HtpG [Lachnospiraceae bacterium]|jgi:molecular chaperone HtpG|nr:molecular chaperone HtpG [Lachnospiraceae bacterium]
MSKKGSLSISSENIFPIIKKWVYSDHDIFVRELISNGVDAITKLKALDMMGEYSLPAEYQPRIDVIISPKNKTIKFIDNGLGMTEDEVEEYITQIAFSGATEFLDKYKDKTSDDDMIGHFGLGFYSAFMVADEVQVDTLSYKKDAKAVTWISEGQTDYEMEDSNRDRIGTEITLFLNDDNLAFANEYKVREVIEKYCAFMPVEIYLSNEDEEKEEVVDVNEDGKAEDADKKEEPKPLNDIHPLWAKTPSEIKDEEYLEFYRKVFLDYKEPLFHIHLNMDYPFNLKGILYFPKINTEYDTIEGTIKLYNNQVFIADNIKEVIPEFLRVLKGVIDCPDLPLNVSRSALQNDGFVDKISDYISKKVAEKLSGMMKTEREEYEKYWDDISPFIKFGFLKDEKFANKMEKSILFKNLDDKYLTLEDVIKENGGEVVSPTEEGKEKSSEEENDENQIEEVKTKIYYVSDPVQQSQYINLFKEHEMDAVILSHNIDSPFITRLEQMDKNIVFERIDADVMEALKDEVLDEEKENFKKESDELISIFRKTLDDEKLDVKVEKLKDDNTASMITLSEQNRRMQEMMKMYGMNNDNDMFKGQSTLILNFNHPLVKYVVEHKRAKSVPVIVKQLYDLAVLTNKPLSPEEMTEFVKRSNEIMLLLTK